MLTLPPTRLASGVLLLILLAPASFDAAADDDLGKLLARPVSPGTLALLISHAKEPEAQARWRHALAHDNPQVRATAARLLHMSGLTSAVPELKAALARESDPDAALQTGRALAALGGADVDALVLDAAARLSSGQLALALAQARGSSAIAQLDALQALDLDDDVELEVVALLTGGDARRLNLIAGAAIDAADVNLWEAVLATADRQSLEPDPALLSAALTSSSATIGDLAWWHVAMLAAAKKPLPDLPQEPRAVEGRDTPPELAFGRADWPRARTGSSCSNRPFHLLDA